MPTKKSKNLQKLYGKEYFYSGKSWADGYPSYDMQKTKDKNTWGFLVDKIIKKKKKGKILEVGCAIPYFVNFFPKSFSKYGTDISEYAIEESKKMFPKTKLVACDISEELPFKTKFDVITALDVLEHTLNLGHSLDNIKSMMKDDGIFVVAVPVASRWHHFLAWLGFSFLTTMPSHLTLTTRDAWADIIFKEKFKIVEEFPITWKGKYYWPFQLFQVFILKKK
jgi:2-polyprenyl-3-methyl-5-hydroxy-6-metoxy-1,4-benzoquinol methylase